MAREAIGNEGFSVVTFGLDPQVDTPERLVAYADSQGVDLTGWDFIALEPEAIGALTDQLGFTYFPSPRGFDHIAQVSIVDSEGLVVSHVYGQDFLSSALVEPLKAAVFDDLAALARRQSGDRAHPSHSAPSMTQGATAITSTTPFSSP